MPVGEVCDEMGPPQSEALWGEEEQRNERTATNRSGEGYEACDDDERTKTGGNASVAKTWQERLSQSGKNRAIAKGRICYLRSMDNRIKQRDAVRRTEFIKLCNISYKCE